MAQLGGMAGRSDGDLSSRRVARLAEDAADDLCGSQAQAEVGGVFAA
jgi:hypothetical protein